MSKELAPVKLKFEENEITTQKIRDQIFTYRETQVIVDRDLANLYGVETKVLNQAVKRNLKRFPMNFRFQLSDNEKKELVTNCDRFEKLKHSSVNPYVFTEQGVSMMSAVLNSETAINVSIQIINAFVDMRKFLLNNVNLFQRIDNIENKLIAYKFKTDEKIDLILEALEDKSITPKQGIFYNGQVFDAYTLIADIIRTAKKSIILIDNYVDDTVLKLFTKRKKNVTTTIYSKTISKVLKQDLAKHNEQYEPIKINDLKTSHDRFLIIDEKTIYHFGASLKDLGKKWFAFSKLDLDVKDITEKL
ncbi:MAG: ORF6N domain-containing protein [Labilibaculum sp.]|nr:ORF6N domain-containing protein [Labilibaculum sp.]MBI9060150.1 ORF6N domain-containing protein [Labilibaculum sp.]